MEPALWTRVIRAKLGEDAKIQNQPLPPFLNAYWFPIISPCLMTHDFPINAYLLLLLQVVRISCSSLVGNGLDHSIIAPIGSIPYLVIDWIQKIHLMIHTIHTIHTLLHTLLTFSTSHGGRAHRNRRQSAAASDGSSARQPGRSCRGWLCRWPCTYRRHEAADAQLKICCFFPDGLWLSGWTHQNEFSPRLGWN